MKTLLKTTFVSLIATTLLASVAVAKGAVDDPHADHDLEQVEVASPTQRVAYLLMAIHELPPKEAFDKIPGARDILERIALDHQVIQQRAAVSALAYYPDAGTFQTYKALLNDPKTNYSIQHTIILNIGKYFQNDEGIEILKKYIKDQDIQIRVSAIYALSYMNSDQAFQVMKEHRAVEKDSHVLSVLDERGYILR